MTDINDTMSEASRGPDVHGCDGCDDPTCGFHPPRPMHGDVWRSPVACRNFTVLYVCGRCERPMVTGHWWRSGSLDPNLHDSIPLARFMSAMTLVEREDFDA